MMKKRAASIGFGILVLFLCGCAGMQAKPEGADAFLPFPDAVAAKAAELEKKGQLRDALLRWKVVSAFRPEDQTVTKKIKGLERETQRQARLHFAKGEEFFKKDSMDRARKEFLLVLAYEPAHEEALHYLRDRIQDQVYVIYKTKPGETLDSIAEKTYKDRESASVIAYFNDIRKDEALKPGTVLKLPIREAPAAVAKETGPETVPREVPAGGTRPEEASTAESYAEPEPEPEQISRDDVYDDLLYMASCLYEDGKYGEARTCVKKILTEDVGNREANDFINKMLDEANRHYRNGIKFFINEKMDQAIEEWQVTLALNPEHPDARKDMEKARDLLKKLGDIK